MRRLDPMNGMDRIVALANRQHGVVHHAQLREQGMTEKAIRRAVDSSKLDPLHHCVYSVGHKRLTASGQRLAASMSVDIDLAMTARFSAGYQQRLTTRRPRHGLTEVAVPSYRGDRRTDVRILRLGSLTEADRVVVDGVPCTTVSRTLLDLAGVLSEHDLGKAIREADFHGTLDLVALAATIARVDRPRGVVKLRELLALEPARHCDSRFERRVLRLLLDGSMPHPVLQQRFIIGRPAETIRVDFFWPDRALAIEADESHHERPSFAARDRHRDAELAKQGIHVHRVTEDAMDADPVGVLTTVLALHTSRA